MAFLSDEALRTLGLRSLGNAVLISDRASIYGAANISIGDNSRIDDYCILSAGAGGISIGRNVHISCYVSMIGQGAISVGDYTGVSGRCSIYSSTDDFSGNAMTGPTVDAAYTNVRSEAVNIGRHCVIGSGCVVLPGVTVHEGVAAGAMSLLNRDCEAFSIYAGIPARKVRARANGMLEKEREYLESKVRKRS